MNFSGISGNPNLALVTPGSSERPQVMVKWGWSLLPFDMHDTNGTVGAEGALSGSTCSCMLNILQFSSDNDQNLFEWKMAFQGGYSHYQRARVEDVKKNCKDSALWKGSHDGMKGDAMITTTFRHLSGGLQSLAVWNIDYLTKHSALDSYLSIATVKILLSQHKTLNKRCIILHSSPFYRSAFVYLFASHGTLLIV